MKALITGASSLPGYRTTFKLLEKGYNIIATHLTNPIPMEHENLEKIKLDVRDFNSLLRLFKENKPEIVIHMVALGNVDECERNNMLAWEINVKGTINIAKLSEKYSKYLLYLSTDYVFDGSKGGYQEYDPPNPINYYGLTKLGGEIAVTTSNVDNAIVRASSIYGFGPGRKNFAKFIFEKLTKGEKIKALIDQYTTPTQASLLAEAINEIVERRLTGIFHIVGERLSRYEFALKVADLFGFDKTLIGEATMKDFNWFAPRPRDASLKCEHTRKLLRVDFHSMEKALNRLKEEYLEEVS